MTSSVLYSCLIAALAFYGTVQLASGNPARETAKRTIDILDAVKRIEEQLAKEERLREITDILKIDSSMDKLNKKMDRLVSMVEGNAVYPATGRSEDSSSLMSTDFVTNFEAIDNRLRSLEASMDKMEEGMEKSDSSFQKIDELERRTTQLKDDMNQKLRKMMNVISAVYEMNKDIKLNFGSRSLEAQDSKQDSNYAAEFLVGNLEELERKIREQFSVLTSEIRSEITSLKIVASTMGGDCTPSSMSDDDDWMTPNEANARSLQGEVSNNHTERSAKKVEDTLDNLVESLGRTTREIREEIHQGMQDIDHKLTNLTVLAKARPQCEDPLQAAESIVSRSRYEDAFLSKAPEQVLEDKNSQRNETCTKVARNVATPKSCAELRKGGANCDGVYVIFPKGVRAVRVYCDMTTDGGGWTMLMRRGDYGDKMTSFHKNWISYKNGFGDSEGEFWLGNDVMNLMTTEESNMLRVHLSSFDGDDINLDFAAIKVDDENANYKLNLGAAIGSLHPAHNSLRYHNNHPFSTFDKKNDKFQQNCALTYKGGWWFNGCYFGFLTGEYFRQGERRENWQGILWYDWKNNSVLKGAEMLIRPTNFLPLRRRN